MATSSELFNLSHELVHVSHDDPLILIDNFDSTSIAAPLVCCICETPIIGPSPVYTCSLEHFPCSFFLHKKCAESPELIINPTHPQHQLHLCHYHLYLRRDPENFKYEEVKISCAVCAREINKHMWAYNCDLCESDWEDGKSATCYPFALCARCVVMESVLDHEGHQHHSLTLLRKRACFPCDACGIEAAEFHSYICHSCHFWIHGSCAAYPRTIKLRIHQDDTLQLVYSIPDMYRRFTRHCPICRQGVNTNNWAYFCEESGYFVHIKCGAALLASGKNVIETEDDEQIYSDLMQFPLPRTETLMKNLVAVHRPGNLTTQWNAIEDEFDNGEESPVLDHWSHPEHKLFPLEELENADHDTDDDDESDDGEESPAVTNHSSHPEHKSFLLEELDNADHNSDDDEESDGGEEGPAVINHWSHPEHKLFLLEELDNAHRNSDDDESDGKKRIDEMLVCDGCVQPISAASNKRYHGCIGCNYFLHTTCANDLPLQSGRGRCPGHPEHILRLHNYNTRPLNFIICHGYDAYTNGFFTDACHVCRLIFAFAVV